eukprot:3082754-Prymnesium_polylepis.1
MGPYSATVWYGVQAYGPRGREQPSDGLASFCVGRAHRERHAQMDRALITDCMMTSACVNKPRQLLHE